VSRKVTTKRTVPSAKKKITGVPGRTKSLQKGGEEEKKLAKEKGRGLEGFGFVTKQKKQRGGWHQKRREEQNTK